MYDSFMMKKTLDNKHRMTAEENEKLACPSAELPSVATLVA